jgi:hypothetical protein
MSDGHAECRNVSGAAFPQGRETHWRLCYDRDRGVRGLPCWRVRDERTGELWLVDDYQGEVNVSRFDRGSHIYHDGKVTVDEKMVAHFAG